MSRVILINNRLQGRVQDQTVREKVALQEMLVESRPVMQCEAVRQLIEKIAISLSREWQMGRECWHLSGRCCLLLGWELWLMR